MATATLRPARASCSHDRGHLACGTAGTLPGRGVPVFLRGCPSPCAGQSRAGGSRAVTSDSFAMGKGSLEGCAGLPWNGERRETTPWSTRTEGTALFPTRLALSLPALSQGQVCKRALGPWRFIPDSDSKGSAEAASGAVLEGKASGAASEQGWAGERLPGARRAGCGYILAGCGPAGGGG